MAFLLERVLFIISALLLWRKTIPFVTLYSITNALMSFSIENESYNKYFNVICLLSFAQATCLVDIFYVTSCQLLLPDAVKRQSSG